MGLSYTFRKRRLVKSCCKKNSVLRPTLIFRSSLCFLAAGSALNFAAMMRANILLRSGFQPLVLFGLLSCIVWPTKAAPPAATPTNAPATPAPGPNRWSTNWSALFDGQSLTNWAVSDFVGHGPITVEDGHIKIGKGEDLGGINWTNGPLPKTDYEISLDAVKTAGADFFCGLTFPVADSSCSLIVGGWGGGLVGLSSLDDRDASENETTRVVEIETGHWYHVVVRVTPQKIEAWLDKENIVSVSIVGRKVSLRPGPIYLSEPLGVATYSTTAELKDFKLRLLEH
jgi:hypothetical protein